MHEIISEFCLMIQPTGSRVICNPPPTNTDEDFIVLAKMREIGNLVEVLHNNGYELGGSDVFDADDMYPDEIDGFQSYKLNERNYIITTNHDFFDKFVYATNIAQKLNLLEKEKRIALFQIILYNNWGD